jgi:very-short-patch-repair endonuclease
MTSGLEATFEAYVEALAPDLAQGMVAQYAVIPGRRWAWDFAWPSARVAVELQGGLYSGGAHARPAGILRDMAKANAAALAGWRVLTYATQHVEDDPMTMLAEIRQLVALTQGAV